MDEKSERMKGLTVGSGNWVVEINVASLIGATARSVCVVKKWCSVRLFNLSHFNLLLWSVISQEKRKRKRGKIERIEFFNCGIVKEHSFFFFFWGQ